MWVTRGGVFALLQTLFAQGAALLVNVVAGVIAARLLGPSGRGELAVVSLWLTLPPMLAVAGTRSAVIYFTGCSPEQAASVGVVAQLYATAVFAPIAMVAYWFAPQLLHGYSSAIVALGRVIILLSVVNVWNVIGRQSLLAEKNYRAFNLITFSESVVYFLLLIVLANLGAVSPRTAALAQVTSVGVVLTPIGILVIAAWCQRAAWKRCSVCGVISYSAKAAPTDLVYVLGAHIDRLVLSGMVTAYELGLYVVALSFARILYVLQNVFSAVMLNDLSGKSAAEIEQVVHWLFRVSLCALMLAFGIFLVIDDFLLSHVFGHAFAPAAPVFRLLLLEAIFSDLAYLLVQACLAAGRPDIPSVIQSTTFALSTAGLLALTPVFGTTGAAAALAAGSAIKLGWLLRALKRIGVGLPNPAPRREDIELLRRFVQAKFG